ncbi:MAG: redoxin domain-containing protein, partial [Myxococcota bacterium]
MAHERAAFAARGVRIIAISVDPLENSRRLAEKLDISYPLIQDEDLKLANAYVGVDEDDYAVPGIILIKPGGEIVFRQIGDAPGDRIYAADLIAVIDRELPEATASAQAQPQAEVVGGYAPLERWQLRIGAALGLSQETSPEDGFGFSLGAEVAALYPLGRNLMVGALARGLTVDSTRVDVDAALRLRLPILYDQAEVYLQIPVGLAIDASNDDDDPNDGLGWNAAAQLGLQFA